jgi:G:T-mismatch repair DNA endonuclease (very short patch repair protein)
MDVLTIEQRRLNMSRIRGKDTKPEMVLRRGLRAAGLRFRLHGAKLPGKAGYGLSETSGGHPDTWLFLARA